VTPLFSVVVPTYNRRERLLRALRSVAAQRCDTREIIVVDDGSTDGSAEAVEDLGIARVIRQPNSGPSAARTAGVSAAAGEYVAFLDSDDAWFPWTLEVYRRVIDREGGPDWVAGLGVVDDCAGPGTTEEAPLQARSFQDYAEAAARDGLLPLPSGVCIKRSVLLETGGFRSTMRVGEDLDLWFRIAEDRRFVLIEAPALYRREVHAGSLGEDVVRSYAGLNELASRELRGGYGGSPATAFVRRAIISRQFMYYALRYREQGRAALAARIYLDVLRLQWRSRFREAGFGGRRNRFLLSFPLFLASPSLHRRLGGAGLSRARS
jgi:glycosyltransferase involved in cell wall biosynthesis